jgi:hypothetical protein
MNVGTVLYHIKGIVLAYVTIEDTSGSYFKYKVNVNVNLKNRNRFIKIIVLAFKKWSYINPLLLCVQVNMMSAQMLSAASNVSGTVADLAPGAKDGMRMLEAKAAQMALLERPGK